jgi:DNA-binding XRE family transcriptional regulator
METIEKNGAIFVLVPQDAWRKIAAGGLAMPEMPAPDENGNRPALGAARALIARGIIRDRAALGWSQAELARQSGVNVETLNRIERAKVTPDEATIRKIDKAIQHGAAPRARSAPASRRISKSKTMKGRA